MKRISYFLFFLLSCREPGYPPVMITQKKNIHPSIPGKTVRYGDSLLHMENGVWYYDRRKYSGLIETYYPDGAIQVRQGIYEGKEEGVRNAYYENGLPESVRYYREGEKDSVHRGWWSNGNPRYEYHYKMGIYSGDWKEWYRSGRLMKYIVYQNGKERSGKGWRENGKPYMSFVVRNGRFYGLVNANLCYSLRNEKGQFVAAGTEKKSPL